MPTGDAPTTSEWSTILLPTKVQLILEVWWYLPWCSGIARKASYWPSWWWISTSYVNNHWIIVIMMLRNAKCYLDIHISSNTFSGWKNVFIYKLFDHAVSNINTSESTYSFFVVVGFLFIKKKWQKSVLIIFPAGQIHFVTTTKMCAWILKLNLITLSM